MDDKGIDLAYNRRCPAWGNLTWPKVGEFNLANGAPADERKGELFKYLNNRIDEMPAEAPRRRMAMR